MNKFKKKSKTKGLALGIAILSSAAVVSTGFAAWVISGGETKDVSGTINADTVTNNYHTLSVVTWNSNQICFGAPKGDTKGSGSHLNNDGQGIYATENLIASGTFAIANVNENPATFSSLFETGKCVFAEDTTENGSDTSKQFATYVTSGYVAEMPVAVSFKDSDTDTSSVGAYIIKGSYSAETKTLTCTVKVVFGWGTAFKNENPFVYFNSDEGAASITSASEMLGNLSKMDAKFKVTIVSK